MIRIIITDDHPVVRKGLRQILEDFDENYIVHEASSGKELVEKLRNQIYDVILLDISMPGQNGLDLIGRIKGLQSQSAILMISIYADEIFALKAMRSGASGFIAKSSNPDEIIKAVIAVADGKKYISPSIDFRTEEESTPSRKLPVDTTLSIREKQVLKLFAEGKTVVQIASILFLSPKTISTYRSRLLAKLKLKTTADLIKYAILEGF